MDSLTPSLPGASADLQRLRARVELARSDAPPPADALVHDLETAYEELRVADEEVRAQHEAIQRLVESHHGLRVRQERAMAILPVPIVVTDAQGLIRSVNAAAAMLVGTRVSRLLGKPVFVLFPTSDRRDLRDLLSSSARKGPVLRRTATLQTRTGQEVAVDVTASDRFPGAGEGEIGWLLLRARDRSEEGAIPVAASLTRLAMLPRLTPGEDVLPSAIAICRDGLGGRAELSIAIGPPLQPDEVVSSSTSAQAWDGAQIASGEGPSDAAFRDGVTTTCRDARADPRWPRLAERLPDDVTAVVAAPIRPGDGVIGTLTAYVTEPWADVEHAVELFALTLSGVLHELELLDELDRLETDMRRALASRAVIDQAKGVVMAARGITAEEAWQHLVRLSSTRHLKVRDVAEDIVARASGRP